MAKMIDRIKQMLGEAPPPPIAQLIGFRLTKIERGEAIIEFEAGETHANPMGTLHGGVLCDVADAAMGLAFATTLGDGESLSCRILLANSRNKPFGS